MKQSIKGGICFLENSFFSAWVSQGCTKLPLPFNDDAAKIWLKQSTKLQRCFCMRNLLGWKIEDVIIDWVKIDLYNNYTSIYIYISNRLHWSKSMSMSLRFMQWIDAAQSQHVRHVPMLKPSLSEEQTRDCTDAWFQLLQWQVYDRDKFWQCPDKAWTPCRKGKMLARLPQIHYHTQQAASRIVAYVFCSNCNSTSVVSWVVMPWPQWSLPTESTACES